MNIDFVLEHQLSNQPLTVEVTFPGNVLVLDLSQPNSNLKLEFDLPVQNQKITLKFGCRDIRIAKFPLTIAHAKLDDFYSSDGIIHSGAPNFDQNFLEYANHNKMYIDTTVTDSNRLDFTGQLVYQFVWPFYKNIFQ